MAEPPFMRVEEAAAERKGRTHNAGLQGRKNEHMEGKFTAIPTGRENESNLKNEAL